MQTESETKGDVHQHGAYVDYALLCAMRELLTP